MCLTALCLVSSLSCNEGISTFYVICIAAGIDKRKKLLCIAAQLAVICVVPCLLILLKKAKSKVSENRK